jgi:8-oxo-dGTP pyrophosphatase MutT (NUDIX family)
MTERLAAALAETLAARPRVVLAPAGTTACAVLVPLLAVDDEPHLLFTRRSHALAHHRGQVSFPGGRHHPGEDADLSATALREAHEEIGLAPDDVRLLGPLDDIATVATRFVITPFVGLVPHPYPWQPCAAEVDAIFTVPVRALTAPGAERRETWDFDGTPVPIDVYPVDGHVIWGATHRITRNLLQVLAPLG